MEFIKGGCIPRRRKLTDHDDDESSDPQKRRLDKFAVSLF